MNKNSAGESLSENYADVLAGTVESNKDSFTEEEYDTLCKDIETIRGIEEELAAIEKRLQKRILPMVDPQNQMNLSAYSRISREKIWMERMSMKAFSRITRSPL